MRHADARRRERQVARIPEPRARIDEWLQLLRAYPEYSRRERIERKLGEDRARAQVELAIRRRDLLEDPDLAGPGALGLDPALLDGDGSNGEIGRQGVDLLTGGRVAWRDRATGERVVLELDEEAAAIVRERVAPGLREKAVRKRVNQPRERARIPLAIEGGFGPGIEAYPGLAPLNPDPDLRRLYE